MTLASFTRHPISIEMDGTIYSGTFAAHKRMITVWYEGQNKMTHLPSSAPPEVLARILLEEIVREHRDKF
jgi:hypothetical protein